MYWQVTYLYAGGTRETHRVEALDADEALDTAQPTRHDLDIIMVVTKEDIEANAERAGVRAAEEAYRS